MKTFLICFAVWFVVWMFWYRLEWKTLARDDPHFTDDARRDIFIGSMTWPFQVVLFLVGMPILFVARRLGWEPKDEGDDDER